MATENQMEMLMKSGERKGAVEFIEEVIQQALKKKFHCFAIEESVTYDGCAFCEMRDCLDIWRCDRRQLDRDLLQLQIVKVACA